MESHHASIEVHAQLEFCGAHRSAQQVVCCATGMALAHLSQDSVPLTRFQGVQDSKGCKQIVPLPGTYAAVLRARRL